MTDIQKAVEHEQVSTFENQQQSPAGFPFKKIVYVGDLSRRTLLRAALHTTIGPRTPCRACAGALARSDRLRIAWCGTA